MEDVWQTWISSLEMDGHSLDEDRFDIENVQEPSCFISQEYYDANSQQTPSQYLMSFENSSMEPSSNSAMATCSSIMDLKTTALNHSESSELPKVIKKTNKNRRTSSEIQDHIMAERKRRQVISERFIALSATIPGLKKTDKIYILEETINYVKQLQEKIKELDNQNTMKNKDSEILIKKSQACTKENDNDEHKDYSKKELPKVKARVINKEVMIGIHCEKQKNIMVKIMGLLQSLHLSLASSSILPFGTSTLKVTIIAQVIKGFGPVLSLYRKMDLEQIVKDLHAQNAQLQKMILNLSKGQEELKALLLEKKKDQKPVRHINPGRRQFTKINMTLAQALQGMLKANLITLRDPPAKPNTTSPRYNPDARCAYHSDSPGHNTNDCWSLKNKIQDMIDAGEFELDPPETPNVITAPLPNHDKTLNAIEDADSDCDLDSWVYPTIGDGLNNWKAEDTIPISFSQE
ncbi:transcription factor ABORTED MICROSPORES isoform X1 [Lathyrus oleraceus]|uniref:transcription factor ABORTED MICROSPORES isoform X1 n=2 Tax=Pisum sativum TaxID=3888 RepID=UPI0021D36869|nr:transcription factor ABORTED MICROSPORES-like isoform X1 [Pisum sativum]